MKKIGGEIKPCLMCLDEHEVDRVEVIENTLFKGEEIAFAATYDYCGRLDQLLETEEMLKRNDLAMKDSYRRKIGLLTSAEIVAIREAYDISQKDFADILGWGKATITRYENHQVQIQAHDDILREIGRDPHWFLEKLENTRSNLAGKAYEKYRARAKRLYCERQDQYLRDAIYAVYAEYGDPLSSGYTELNLHKVREMVNYFASKIDHLYKVKLMKCLWYGDALHFKRYGKAISGLVYKALPMGAVPAAYNQILCLEGIEFDEIPFEDNTAYKFRPVPGFSPLYLAETEIEVLDMVIRYVGHLNTKSIVEKMHAEIAYEKTPRSAVISFELADKLSIG